MSGTALAQGMDFDHELRSLRTHLEAQKVKWEVLVVVVLELLEAELVS